jgi:hypothetical protein
MIQGSRLVIRPVAALLLGVLGLAGCETSESPAPATGGAGIPTNRGPVSSKMPKPGGAAKSKAAAPAATAAPATPPATEPPPKP